MSIGTRAGAALAALLAALATGCGSSGPSGTTGQSAQNGSNSAVSAAYAYARCMRSHGVPNFPDPKVVVSPGRQAVGFAVNPSETGLPKFKSADKTCARILPAPSNPSPAQQRAHKQDLLAFARCLRTNGIHGFPDPDIQGRLTLQMVAAAGVDIHSRTFLDAAKACVGVTNGAITLPQIEAAVSGRQG
jgi:hypothetical protein